MVVDNTEIRYDLHMQGLELVPFPRFSLITGRRRFFKNIFDEGKLRYRYAPGLDLNPFTDVVTYTTEFYLEHRGDAYEVRREEITHKRKTAKVFTFTAYHPDYYLI